MTNSFINVLANSILAKDFENCSTEELRNLSEKHPYAAALQFLYAQKLLPSKEQYYEKQLQRTLLYYNNPLFVNYLINNPNITDKEQGTIASITDSVETTSLTQKTADQKPTLSNDGITFYEELKAVKKLPTPEFHIQLNHQTEEEDIETEDTVSNDSGVETEDLPPLPEFKIEAIDPANAQLSFTPYYTVDYFAAQGIKLGSEANTEDRFGVQLKSFTTWLKQMKRLPGATTETNITLKEEKNIEQLAVESLSGENADTEAMAEVWAKQGNLKKAIEVYKKLSLQIPTKSAYFAAKIDFLKK